MWVNSDRHENEIINKSPFHSLNLTNSSVFFFFFLSCFWQIRLFSHHVVYASKDIISCAINLTNKLTHKHTQYLNSPEGTGHPWNDSSFNLWRSHTHRFVTSVCVSVPYRTERLNKDTWQICGSVYDLPALPFSTFSRGYSTDCLLKYIISQKGFVKEFQSFSNDSCTTKPTILQSFCDFFYSNIRTFLVTLWFFFVTQRWVKVDTTQYLAKMWTPVKESSTGCALLLGKENTQYKKKCKRLYKVFEQVTVTQLWSLRNTVLRVFVVPLL